MLTTTIELMKVSLVTVMVLSRSFILKATNTESPEDGAVNGALVERRHDSDSGMPMPVAPSFAIFCRSSSVPLMRSFLPLKSASCISGCLAA